MPAYIVVTAKLGLCFIVRLQNFDPWKSVTMKYVMTENQIPVTKNTIAFSNTILLTSPSKIKLSTSH